MIRQSKNNKKLFVEDATSRNLVLKEVPNSRVNGNAKKNTIVKALFLRKKQHKLSESIGEKVSWDIDDNLIMEQLNSEERDLVDFVQKCLVLIPSKRLTCEDALKHPFILTQAKKRNTPWSSA